MINYILIALGAVFAIIGIILFVKKQSEDAANKIKFLGIELETKSSSLIIFTVGVALIAFGATVGNKNESKDTDLVKPQQEIPAPKDKTVIDSPVAKRPDPVIVVDQPFKEFALAAAEKHVINELQITLTLIRQRVSTANTVSIRIWRNITQPISDTAVLDPSGSQPGVEVQVFKLNAITPISITGVGAYKFYVSNAIISNNFISSVQVKMYKN